MKKAYTQHCTREIEDEMLNSSYVRSITFGAGGQVIALKTATTLIPDR